MRRCHYVLRVQPESGSACAVRALVLAAELRAACHLGAAALGAASVCCHASRDNRRVRSHSLVRAGAFGCPADFPLRRHSHQAGWALQAALRLPRSCRCLPVSLADFAWLEKDLPRKLKRRPLPAGEPMFCERCLLAGGLAESHGWAASGGCNFTQDSHLHRKFPASSGPSRLPCTCGPRVSTSPPPNRHHPPLPLLPRRGDCAQAALLVVGGVLRP